MDFITFAKTATHNSSLLNLMQDAEFPADGDGQEIKEWLATGMHNSFRKEIKEIKRLWHVAGGKVPQPTKQSLLRRYINNLGSKGLNPIIILAQEHLEEHITASGKPAKLNIVFGEEELLSVIQPRLETTKVFTRQASDYMTVYHAVLQHKAIPMTLQCSTAFIDPQFKKPISTIRGYIFIKHPTSIEFRGMSKEEVSNIHNPNFLTMEESIQYAGDSIRLIRDE